MRADQILVVRSAIAGLEELVSTPEFRPAHPREKPDDLAGRADSIYRARRRRDVLFGDAALFGEGSYDILLDLYVQRARNAEVSISSACIASNLAGTTALRHLDRLMTAGLTRRIHDRFDGRRSFVRLTDFAVEKLECHLQDC